MLSDKVATSIAVVVTVVWVVNFAADLFLPGYESQSEINGVFLAIVGGALALSRGRTDKDDG